MKPSSPSQEKAPLRRGLFLARKGYMPPFKHDWRRFLSGLDSRLNPHWWQCPTCFWSDTFRAFSRQLHCPDCGSILRDLDDLRGKVLHRLEGP